MTCLLLVKTSPWEVIFEMWAFFCLSTVSLPFSSVLKFIDKQFENSRLLTEGEAVFEAKHVVVCSVKERTDEDITLAALVLQSSAINKDPH